MFHKVLLVGLFALVASGVADGMPRLKLPWGTWEATVFPGDDEVPIPMHLRRRKTTNT